MTSEQLEEVRDVMEHASIALIEVLRRNLYPAGAFGIIDCERALERLGECIKIIEAAQGETGA